MRVLRLYAENLLNLRAVAIAPEGNVIRVTGKNGAGKSSILNAMFYALTGKKGQAPEPIRRGTRRATVTLELGNGDATELTVSLRITEHSQTLDVESPDGTRFRSPTTMLETIIGKLTFDPHAFSRMHPKQRLQTLRELVSPEIDVDALDRENERDYALRTEWNRKVDSFKERTKSLSLELDHTIDLTPIDVSSLTKRLADASEHNSAIDRQQDARKQQDDLLVQLKAEREDLIARLATLERRIETGERVVTERQPLPERIDVRALQDEADAAIRENQRREIERDRREALAFAERELEAAMIMSQNMSDAMQTRHERKAEAIAAMKMPIDGLGFGNGDVTYNGLPFEQASTGQQLRIATAIGMALNPRLRVLCVRDGSLLDSDSRRILEEMAEEHDFQLWIECTQDQATVGIHITDGEVAAINGVPVDAGEAVTV
jgi:recombinational DNA repair ATPase RecF